MSNAHKIIKNFTSDKFSPELKVMEMACRLQ